MVGMIAPYSVQCRGKARRCARTSEGGRAPCGARPSFALLVQGSSDDVDAADRKRPAMAYPKWKAMLGTSAEVGK